MLPTTLFFLALFCSIFTILNLIDVIMCIQKRDTSIIIQIIASCYLWSYLFYLLH